MDVERPQDPLACELAEDGWAFRDPHGELVQELALGKRPFPAGQRLEPGGQGVGPLETDLGHLPQAVGAHIGHVDAGRQRAQRMVRTDVGGRLLAADVLLARGQGQVEAAATLFVVGGSDQPARKAPHELFAAGYEADVRSAVAWAQTELLSLSHGDVCAVLAGRREDGEADRVDAGDRERAGGVSVFRESPGVDQEAEKVRLLEDHSRSLRA